MRCEISGWRFLKSWFFYGGFNSIYFENYSQKWKCDPSGVNCDGCIETSMERCVLHHSSPFGETYNRSKTFSKFESLFGQSGAEIKTKASNKSLTVFPRISKAVLKN